jgi:protein-arginine kinase activator protein McsA
MINQLFKMDDLMSINGFEKKTYKSDDGLISFTYITNNPSKLNKTDELNLLKQELENAVDEQRFEDAVKLRDKIKNVEKHKSELEKLNKELNECIKSQNFERAIELRDEIKKLK